MGGKFKLPMRMPRPICFGTWMVFSMACDPTAVACLASMCFATHVMPRISDTVGRRAGSLDSKRVMRPVMSELQRPE